MSSTNGGGAEFGMVLVVGISIFDGEQLRFSSPAMLIRKRHRNKKSRRSESPWVEACFVGLLIYQFLSKRRATFI